MKLLSAALALGLVGHAFAHGDEHRPTIRQMGYLTGDWVHAADGVTIEEHWVGPVGGVMAGLAITHSDRPGAATRIEFMSIEERDGTLVFTARPGGAQVTEFRLTESDNGIATFENPQHDFPQRITYAIDGGELETLVARIEGGGREIEWRYARMAR